MWKGVLKVLLAVVHGIEHSATAPYTGSSSSSSSKKSVRGLASAFGALELAHTHYWKRQEQLQPQQQDDGTAAAAAGNQLTTDYVGPNVGGKQRPASVTSTVNLTTKYASQRFPEKA